MIKYLHKYSLILLLPIILSNCNSDSKTYFDILDYGAVSDAETLNTTFIQKAIDDAGSAGGGTVLIPPGVFLSGTLILRNNVNLHLQAGAVLLGSPNIEDYITMSWGHNKDRQPWHLIYADGVKNISITGKGTIDGNGEHFWEEYEKDENGEMIVPRWIKAKEKKVSPLIDINNSQNISITDITVKTGGGWNIHLFDCDIAKISRVNIINNIFSPNSDGIDLTGCSDVNISDCYIKTCDDAICVKTVADSRESLNITITNCTIETLCVGIKLGAGESYKDMRDITISNCVITKSSRLVGLYSKNGAMLENITVTNITGNNNAPMVFNRPIQLMVEKNKEGKVGGIKNLSISNFSSYTDGRILMTCEEGGIMENIILRDVILTYPWIEDPLPIFPGARSNQFPKKEKHPEAGGVRAAVVAENIKNLMIDNLILNLPESNVVPDYWRHLERIENGTTRIHKYNYENVMPVDFSFVWGRKLVGGNLSVKGNGSQKGIPKYDIKNSSIKIVN